jgi:pimeloyl-ACP methyl ester carboxylesterase
MPYATGSGVRIHYEVEGSGVPLVLHPGFAGSLADWYSAGYVDALKGQYTLVLMDQRGHGASGKPHETARYTIDQRVADILAVLDALGIDRAHFLGYSAGGNFGFYLGAWAPYRCLSLALGAGTPFGAEPNVAWAKLLDQGMETFIAEGIERALGPLPADVRARLLTINDARALAASLLAGRPSLEAALGSIDLPILLYCGDQDHPAHELNQRAAALLPRATFVTLPGLGHLEGLFQSAVVLPHLTAFLAGVSAGAGAPASS